MSESNWFQEYFHHNSYSQGFKVKSLLHEEQSAFQKITVLDTYAVGKLLLLDGKTMVSDADEFVYHEVMSHLPYMAHPQAKNILIIGGGDGGIVREFVKHKDIEKIVLVEIDERVIEVSKKYFPNCTSGLSDPRVEIKPMDGFEYIKNHENEFDIIIIDSTDPVDFAQGLFTKEFYGMVKKALRHDGIMMNQTENPFLDEFDIKSIYQNMRNEFKNVKSFSAPLLIYPGTYWTFGFSSDRYQPTHLVQEKINSMKEIEKNLKWYNMDWHMGAFQISNFHKLKIGEM